MCITLPKMNWKIHILTYIYDLCENVYFVRVQDTEAYSNFIELGPGKALSLTSYVH